MANSFIPVDDKYYNAQLVGKVFTQVETDPDTQVETTHYIMETLGGQRKEIPQEIFDDIVNGEYTPGGVTVDDQISDTSENPVQNKVIYRQIQGVAELAEGKSAAYVVDDEIDTAFNSQDSTITINSSFTDVNIGVVSLDKLRIGDVIYVTETDVPDRWVQTITKQGDEVVSVTLGKMETAKVPVLDVQVNHQSVVTDGVAEIPVDSTLDPTSENPVQNKVVTEALSEKANTSELALKQDVLSQSTVDSGTPTEALGFDGNGNLVRGAISGGKKLYKHRITITSRNSSITYTDINGTSANAKEIVFSMLYADSNAFTVNSFANYIFGSDKGSNILYEDIVIRDTNSTLVERRMPVYISSLSIGQSIIYIYCWQSMTTQSKISWVNTSGSWSLSDNVEAAIN